MIQTTNDGYTESMPRKCLNCLHYSDSENSYDVRTCNNCRNLDKFDEI
jgi:hypothetical protein